MDDNTYKEQLLNSGIFKHASQYRYTCQCPFCNDNKAHMYVLIKLSDNTPLLYKCFKCLAHGIVNKKFLEYFDLDNIKLPKNNAYTKKISTSKLSTSFQSTVNEDNPNVINVIEYINSRVGHTPTISELQSFQYISDPASYIREYFGCESKGLVNRHWFRMTNGGIIGRYNSDNTDRRWLKYKFNKELGKGLYTIKALFDLHKTINVYIAEGIMDVIGLYYNYTKNNNIYIATLGSNYIDGINHIISLGIFGDNINIKIFKDSNINTKDIYIDKDLLQLFGKIEIFQNVKGKDYGLLPDELEICNVLSLNKKIL